MSASLATSAAPSTRTHANATGWGDIQEEDITFEASDGFVLAGTTFVPPQPRASLLLSSGTGIPRRFYTSFARHLAERGFAVLTYDYRGIGDSRPESLKGFEASKLDWGRLDQVAAWKLVRERWPERPHFIFGHSVGAQLLGLLDDLDQAAAVASYGAGFGYWGGMEGSYKYFVASLWYLVIPVTTALLGYVPAKRLGLGEDLPREVGRDWARWGKRADYFGSEIGDAPGFAVVDVPWRAYVASDDQIATPDNARGLYEMFQAEIELEWLDPHALGYEDLGHLLFFSRRRRKAWPTVSDWFVERLEEIEARQKTSTSRS